MVTVMNTTIDSFISKVEKKCETGEEFDIYPMYGGLTIDIFARTAFGIQSDSQNNPYDLLLRTIKILFSEDITNPVYVLARQYRLICERVAEVVWGYVAHIRRRCWMNKIIYLTQTTILKTVCHDASRCQGKPMDSKTWVKRTSITEGTG
ncbi:hypothetical protein AVEN_183949-1 [Araneus ventricosus]|uniref:Uncharacterized protein n=1 Tax=Araneus ventricosus TaxID=182803 RepID=A0A4Y2E0D8_ARAVE|nr:hypothetical protein AVEN_183949-1 [Araneus ventricosus]